MKKITKKIGIRFIIVGDFFKTLWRYKLWWSFPIIFLLLFLMVFLFIVGHTGVAVFSYPLF
jgi:hypothetical protein